MSDLNDRNCAVSVLVIIPTFNRALMLMEAIDSVLQHNYINKTIMIIDDGSTDNTKEICKGYINRFPDIIKYQYKQNGGCSSARNVGLELLKEHSADYVCFLDSDDRLLPGSLGDRIGLMQSLPDVDFCYADSIIYDVDKQEEHVAKVAAGNHPEYFAIEHYLTNEAKSASILYRSQIIKTKRFREDLKYNEDSDFLQRIAIEYKGIHSPQPASWVRWHSGSKSKNLLKIYPAVFQVSQGILEEYPQFYMTYKDLIDKRMLRIKRDCFFVFASAGDKKNAEKYIYSPIENFVLNYGGVFFYQKIMGLIYRINKVFKILTKVRLFP